MNCNFEAFIGVDFHYALLHKKAIAKRMNGRPADEKISRWFLLDCYCASTCSKSMGSEHLIVFMYLLLYCNEGGHKFIE